LKHSPPLSDERASIRWPWTVSRDDDSVVLNVAADPGRPDDIAAIAALFQAA